MEQKKIYVIGVLMNPDMDDEAELHGEDFENYAFTDYEKAKEAFAQATKAMLGYEISLDDLLRAIRALSQDGKSCGLQTGHKAVRFWELEQVPGDMDISHWDTPIDPDYFRDEEIIELDGEESEMGKEQKDGR